MEVIYSNHAIEKLEERKISKKAVERAISNPDRTIDSRLNRKIVHKIIRNKLLRIVLKEQNDIFIVITAYYTRPERYGEKI